MTVSFSAHRRYTMRVDGPLQPESPLPGWVVLQPPVECQQNEVVSSAKSSRPPSPSWRTHIHRPALIAPLRTAPESVDAGPRRQRTLMHEPALEHQQSIHCLTVRADPFDETQHCPEPPVTESRMRLDQTLNALRQDLVEPRGCRSNYRARPQPGTGRFQNSAHSAHRYAGQRHYHSSDVPGVIGRLAASAECPGPRSARPPCA
jgi:hypothetical protein